MDLDNFRVRQRGLTSMPRSQTIKANHLLLEDPSLEINIARSLKSLQNILYSEYLRAILEWDPYKVNALDFSVFGKAILIGHSVTEFITTPQFQKMITFLSLVGIQVNHWKQQKAIL